jgi:hypothetical protein
MILTFFKLHFRKNITSTLRLIFILLLLFLSFFLFYSAELINNLPTTASSEGIDYNIKIAYDYNLEINPNDIIQSNLDLFFEINLQGSYQESSSFSFFSHFLKNNVTNRILITFIDDYSLELISQDFNIQIEKDEPALIDFNNKINSSNIQLISLNQNSILNFTISNSITSRPLLNTFRDIYNSFQTTDPILIFSQSHYDNFISNLPVSNFFEAVEFSFSLDFGLNSYSEIIWTYRGRTAWNNFLTSVDEMITEYSFTVSHSYNRISESIELLNQTIIISFSIRFLVTLLIFFLISYLLIAFLSERSKMSLKNDELLIKYGLSKTKLTLFMVVELLFSYFIAFTIASFCFLSGLYLFQAKLFDIKNFYILLSIYSIHLFLALIILIFAVILVHNIFYVIKINKIVTSDNESPSISIFTKERQITLLIGAWSLFVLINGFFGGPEAIAIGVVILGIIIFTIFLWFLPDVLEILRVFQFIFKRVSKVNNLNPDFSIYLSKVFRNYFSDVLRVLFFIFVLSIIIIGNSNSISYSLDFTQTYGNGGDLYFTDQSFNQTLVNQISANYPVETITYVAEVSARDLTSDDFIFIQQFNLVGIDTSEMAVNHFKKFENYIFSDLNYNEIFEQLKLNNIIISSSIEENYRLAQGDNFRIYFGENEPQNVSLTIGGTFDKFPGVAGDLNILANNQEESISPIILMSYELLQNITSSIVSLQPRYLINLPANIAAEVQQRLSDDLDKNVNSSSVNSESMYFLLGEPILILIFALTVIMVNLIFTKITNKDSLIIKPYLLLLIHGFDKNIRSILILGNIFSLIFLLFTGIFLYISIYLVIQQFFLMFFLQILQSFLQILVLVIVFTSVNFGILLAIFNLFCKQVNRTLMVEGLNILI